MALRLIWKCQSWHHTHFAYVTPRDFIFLVFFGFVARVAPLASGFRVWGAPRFSDWNISRFAPRSSCPVCQLSEHPSLLASFWTCFLVIPHIEMFERQARCFDLGRWVDNTESRTQELAEHIQRCLDIRKLGKQRNMCWKNVWYLLRALFIVGCIVQDSNSMNM